MTPKQEYNKKTGKKALRCGMITKTYVKWLENRYLEEKASGSFNWQISHRMY